MNVHQAMVEGACKITWHRAWVQGGRPSWGQMIPLSPPQPPPPSTLPLPAPSHLTPPNHCQSQLLWVGLHSQLGAGKHVTRPRPIREPHCPVHVIGSATGTGSNQNQAHTGNAPTRTPCLGWGLTLFPAGRRSGEDGGCGGWQPLCATRREGEVQE